MEFTNHYSSSLGGITLASDGEALTGLWFDNQKRYAETLEKDRIEDSLPVFELTKHWLDIYFSGMVPDFTPQLKLKTSAFTKEIAELLLAIPYGSTVTYGELAERYAEAHEIKKMSAQAVGGAVGRNPISIIIPCHRVIGAKGALIGYSAGTEKKQKLLSLEQRAAKQLSITT